MAEQSALNPEQPETRPHIVEVRPGHPVIDLRRLPDGLTRAILTKVVDSQDGNESLEPGWRNLRLAAERWVFIRAQARGSVVAAESRLDYRDQNAVIAGELQSERGWMVDLPVGWENFEQEHYQAEQNQAA